MSKKLLAACMVIAAFAVAPSFASANPVVTHPTGTILKPGTLLEATNIGETVMTLSSGGELKCTVATLTGPLHVNETTKGAEAEITFATFAGTGTVADVDKECTGPFNASVTPTGLPWCLEATENNDKFKLRGGKCTEAAKALSFTLVGTILGFPVNCKYQRTAVTGPVTGTFTTHTTGDLIGTVEGEPVFSRIESPESCPASGKLHMKYTVETDNGLFEPVYMSS
jgi:hypothetical protein